MFNFFKNPQKSKAYGLYKSSFARYIKSGMEE